MDRQALPTVDKDIGQSWHDKFPSTRYGSTAAHLRELIQPFAGCADRLGNSLGDLGSIGGDVFKNTVQVVRSEFCPSGHFTPHIS